MISNKKPSSSLSLLYGRRKNSSTTSTVTNHNNISDMVLLDTTDVKRKLYGKNEHFNIIQEAVVKIQKFVRGSLSRGRTSDMIQELIDGILSYREIVAKYAAEDEQRVKKQQLDLKSRNNNVDEEEVDHLLVQGSFIINCSPRRNSIDNKPWLRPDNNYTPSGTPIEVALKERLNILDCPDSSTLERPWAKHHVSKKQIMNASDEITEISVEEDSTVEEYDEHKCPLSTNDGLNLDETQVCLNNVVSLSFEQDQDLEISNLPQSTEFTTEGCSNNNTKSAKKLQRQHVSKEYYDDEIILKEDGTDQTVSFPEEYLEDSVAIELGGRGYNRYRSSAAGRNKRRPWRDDTNVFDAY